MATILLHDRKGAVVATVLVDDEDFALLSQTPWCRHKSGYAKRALGGNRQILMHRQIMGDPPVGGLEIDHINRCKLDNRRGNLRWVTRAQNATNSKTRADSITGERHIHRRVSPRTGRTRFFVTETLTGGVTRPIGPRFDTIAEAVAFRDHRKVG